MVVAVAQEADHDNPVLCLCLCLFSPNLSPCPCLVPSLEGIYRPPVCHASVDIPLVACMGPAAECKGRLNGLEEDVLNVVVTVEGKVHGLWEDMHTQPWELAGRVSASNRILAVQVVDSHNPALEASVTWPSLKAST